MTHRTADRTSRRSRKEIAAPVTPPLPLAIVAGFFVVVLAGWAHEARAAAADDQGLTIRIENVQSEEGRLMLQLLRGEEAFTGGAPSAASFAVPAKAGSVTLSIDSLPPGEYAIRVMQDLDGDGELARNLTGMPIEPWGMSNDAAGSFGPPSWKDVRFTLPETTEQVITLR